MTGCRPVRFAFFGFLFFAACLVSVSVDAQRHSSHGYEEVGGWIGVANYYGDLNPLYGVKGTRPAIGGFYRRTLSDYIAFRGGASLAMLEYKDSYNTNLPWQQVRNLSFRTHVFEVGAALEFHFLQYRPQDPNRAFTPYLSLGFSLFHFRPQAQLDGQWHDLTKIGTEGQNTDLVDNEPYKLIQPALPVGLGIKYWAKGKWTLGAEIGYRFTFTDYLDDVSGTYINSNLWGPDQTASLLADPSQITNPDDPLSRPAGGQRGDSTNNDAYLFFGVNVSYAIFKVKCP